MGDEAPTKFDRSVMTSVGDSGRRYVAYCQDCGLKLNGVTGAW